MRLQKDTGIGRKLHGKWYDDACGAVFGMELIGERWALPVVRELMLGGRRFSDIRASLPGISAKVLTERLEGLEAAGIVTRVTLAAPAPAKLYALTPWGLALEPVMQELGRWSVQSPEHNPQLPLTPVSLMLSFRTMLDPGAARDVEATVRFEVGADQFDAKLTGGELHIARTSPERAAVDLVFRAAEGIAYLRAFYGKQPLGTPGLALELEGDRTLAERFIGCFRLPPKQPPPPDRQA